MWPVKIKRTWIPYAVLMPAIITTIGILVPFVFSIVLSFTGYSFRSPTMNFIGLANWTAMFSDPAFWQSLGTTCIYAILTTAMELILGIGIALLLYKFSGPIISVLKVALVIPLMVAPVIATLIWQLMLNTSVGIVEKFLNLFGLYNFPWAASPSTALLTVALIDIWVYTPFVMLLVLAGLHTLPKSPFEAAQLDGGSPFFVFRSLLLPLLKPFIYIALIFRLMAAFQEFAIIFALTKGGPGDATMTLSLRGYTIGFAFSRMAAAIPYLLVLWMIIYYISSVLVRRFLISLKTQNRGTA